MSIYIDADSCHKKVREYVAKRANQLKIDLYLVANKEISIDGAEFKMIVCPVEKDSADNYIFQNVLQNDIVITRDILLASRLVEKNICTINDRGTSFKRDNIKRFLEERDFSLQLSQIGLVGKKGDTYTSKDFGKFKQCFEYVTSQ